MKPRVVFFGTPDFVVPVLEALIKNFQVVGVVTAPDQKVGRKHLLTPSPIKLASQVDGLRAWTPEKLKDGGFIQEMKNLNPDLFVVVSYGKIIPKILLEIPKYGVLNVHYSLLPKYRGATPMQTAILNGDKVSGITILKMDEKLDHGPIISTKKFRLSEQSTFDSLSKEMTLEAIPLLVKVIPEFISGKITPKPQNEAQVTVTKLITKEDGYFDINPQAGGPPAPDLLDKKIRAYYPWPNVWTKWNNKIVKFYPRKMIQMEGKNPSKLEDFLRGYPNFPIKSL